jgi:glutamate racemase
MGHSVKIISSGDETANDMSAILHHNGLLNPETEEPNHEFFTTGSTTIFRKIASKWLNKRIENVRHIKID